jgi:hypothetical protein
MLIEHLAEIGDKGHAGIGLARLRSAVFMHVSEGGEVHQVILLKALDSVPAFASRSDEGDVELLIGSEDGAWENLNSGECGSRFGEEVTTIEHGWMGEE